MIERGKVQLVLLAPRCLPPSLLIKVYLPDGGFSFPLPVLYFLSLMNTAILSMDGQFDDGFNISVQHSDISLRLGLQGLASV